MSALAVACGGEEPAGDGDRPERSASAGTAGLPKLDLREVGRFEQPVHALAVPGTDLVAIVEKGGRVVVTANLTCVDAERCPARPATGGTTVVDLRGSVSTGSEQGLLGMAFHPSWPDDQRIFLNYTDGAGDTRIETWIMAGPRTRATRERELLRIEQPYENHNGGHLAFGPDGLLYIGTGDGGAGGDPEDRAQRPDDRLGKLLRVDVDGGGERGYAIPDGNVERGAPEVWAIGLRNPWRFSFDSKTGDLWIGDVGQNEFEEIDAVRSDRVGEDETLNFGWRRYEGNAEFELNGTRGPGEQVEPVLTYGRDDGCSVTGGVVYRGEAIPDLRGAYVFGDFCVDGVRILDASGVPGSSTNLGADDWTSAEGAAQVASIAEVQRGELLVVSLDGTIRQVLPA